MGRTSAGNTRYAVAMPIISGCVSGVSDMDFKSPRAALLSAGEGQAGDGTLTRRAGKGRLYTEFPVGKSTSPSSAPDWSDPAQAVDQGSFPQACDKVDRVWFGTRIPPISGGTCLTLTLTYEI
ncbi:hypothetical protein V8F20_010189 [Naviculisporaceae sp. PSN 640]